MKKLGLFAMIQLASVLTWADVGVMMYESVGAGKRETDTGHSALVSTRLCSDNYLAIRKCAPGEEPGVVIQRYSSILSNRKIDWIAVPLKDHLVGSSDNSNSPVLTTGQIKEVTDIEYWHKHLSNVIPAISNDELQGLIKAGHKVTIKKIMGNPLGPVIKLATFNQKKQGETGYAFYDDNGLIIPAGHWTDAISSRQLRDSTMYLVQTSEEEENRLLTSLPSNDKQRFNALRSNCADFSKDALKHVFADPEFKLPNPMANPSDLFGQITTPLALVKGVVGYAHNTQRPLSVDYFPQTAGSREFSAPDQTVADGTLTPNMDQGLLAFSLKLFLGHTNPYIGIATHAAHFISRPINVEKEVHKAAGDDLSDLQNQLRLLEADLKQKNLSIDTDQVATLQNKIMSTQLSTFGTSKCWSDKRASFKAMLSQAQESGVLTADERGKLLKPGKGNSFPKHLENLGMKASYRNGELVAAIGNDTTGLTRANIESYKTDSSLNPKLALRVMIGLINYDLSSSVSNRRTTLEFDPDWQLFLQVAADNQIRANADAAKSVSSCSEDEVGVNAKVKDIRAQNLTLKHMMMNQIMGPINYLKHMF